MPWKDKEHQKAYHREWKRNHPGYWRKSYTPEKAKVIRDRYKLTHPLKGRIDNLAIYGLTLEDYENMVKSQKGVCKMCKKPEIKRKHLSVDHCHSTSKVRGLLCNLCNNSLGTYEKYKNICEQYLNERS